MTEAITDTGPILHLHEIGRLDSLQTFQTLIVTNLVQQELVSREIDVNILAPIVSLRLETSPLTRREIPEAKLAHLQAADLEVLTRAGVQDWQGAVLTDDLALRRVLEKSGATVTGSFGILVRAYSRGVLSRQGLDTAVEALLEDSSLHAGKAFKIVARRQLRELR